jgi:hypothetical protein
MCFLAQHVSTLTLPSSGVSLTCEIFKLCTFSTEHPNVLSLSQHLAKAEYALTLSRYAVSLLTKSVSLNQDAWLVHTRGPCLMWTNNKYVRFEVRVVSSMKMRVFWDIAPRSLAGTDLHTASTIRAKITARGHWSENKNKMLH